MQKAIIRFASIVMVVLMCVTLLPVCSLAYDVDPAVCEHTFEATVLEDNSNRFSAATCTSPAVYRKVCLSCGMLSEETFESGTALGHALEARVLEDNSNLVSAATCTSPAVYKKVCSVCGAQSEETFEIGAALGHTFEATVLEDNTRRAS